MSLIQSNRVLQAAEKKLESGLTPETKANYQKIVTAGMKTALQGGPKGILASLKQSKDPLTDCAKGAVNLCLLMRKQSRGTMPFKAMVPAGMTLMINALDFADHANIIKVGAVELSKASRIYGEEMFKAFGITAPMLQSAATKVHAITQDPAQMEKIHHAAGMTKAPGAAPPQGGTA